MPEAFVTGEAVALDLPRAGLATRGLALAIDLGVMYGAGTVLELFVGAALIKDEALGAAAAVIVTVLIVLGYPVAMLVFNRGRTVGKLALGLRVVRDDGGPVAFRQAFVRELAGIVDKLPFGLIGTPFILFREDGKRIGDLLAGTTVISERVASTGYVHAGLIMPPQLAGWAGGLDLSRLPDSLALRSREILGRMGSLQPAAREQLGAQLTAAVAEAVGPPPPGTPGWAYLSAVLAERHRRDTVRLRAVQENAMRRAAAQGFRPGRPVGMAAYDQELA